MVFLCTSPLPAIDGAREINYYAGRTGPQATPGSPVSPSSLDQGHGSSIPIRRAKYQTLDGNRRESTGVDAKADAPEALFGYSARLLRYWPSRICRMSSRDLTV